MKQTDKNAAVEDEIIKIYDIKKIIYNPDLTSEGLEIINIYLSYFNPTDPQKKQVSISNAEIAKVMGTKDIQINEVKELFKNLMKTVLVIYEDDISYVGMYIMMFESASPVFDGENLCAIILECTNKAQLFIQSIVRNSNCSI